MITHLNSTPTIRQSNFDFLTLLKENNNREWFNVHRADFDIEQGILEAFAEALLAGLNKEDVMETPSGRKSLYRIYRDVRFSKDKTPFQIYWGGRFKRATKSRRGGYYYHIEQGNSFLAGGFWGPGKDDLKLIRENLAFDDAPLREILNSNTFTSNFGSLKGEQLKTAPKGYPADHLSIDLLRYKQFLVFKRFSDEEVLSEGFLDAALDAFRSMRPFFDYMSEVLTTDRNGLEL